MYVAGINLYEPPAAGETSATEFRAELTDNVIR